MWTGSSTILEVKRGHLFAGLCISKISIHVDISFGQRGDNSYTGKMKKADLDFK